MIRLSAPRGLDPDQIADRKCRSPGGGGL